ncbi:altronate dehydratase family protein [Arthrobacter sp. zg-Y826]|uniref:UxaA family hydrolase n=1 Tax=Arthrobacter jinronghuae TaxID=2964609 RepID=UPI002101E60C|nr:altronate dehydratase family protein [Arthrobacter jinronghuae]MCQ1955244.1 altronate dehydratase family protein [Arthrobacter jinronghuae]
MSASQGSVLRLSPADEVGVALRLLPAGVGLNGPDGGILIPAADIPQGHKIALVDLPVGATVHKYGQAIGRTTSAVAAGGHVHSHNLAMAETAAAYEFGTARFQPPAEEGRRFRGYRRRNGLAGTRNYIGILTSVNCSAGTARMIADQFRGPVLDAFPNVDGVMALTHSSGCGMVLGSPGAEVLFRTLSGYARHPNFAGLLVVGLGCEMLQADRLIDDTVSADVVERLVIQESGGVRASVRAGVELVRQMLPVVNRLQRIPIDAAELVLGMNCGGSDGYSGITANPALGVASDRLIGCGGTSVLAETPEVFGAEHLLTRRAVSRAVGERLLARLQWWQEYTGHGGGSLDNNPSPGNKAGGLTTILEKSLGAVAKAGRAELREVVDYAGRIRGPGLVFMDTPGYDPVSVTGIVAGGANVVCFTTGRGSVLGCRPAPSIKLGTNTELFRRMPEDIDINCGEIIDSGVGVEEMGARIFARILETASGRQTVSEELELGQEEFVPWQLGAVT